MPPDGGVQDTFSGRQQFYVCAVCGREEGVIVAPLDSEPEPSVEPVEESPLV